MVQNKRERKFAVEIESYLKHGTVLGPFKDTLFWTDIFLSPLNNVAEHKKRDR